jgi:hypothetical protein
MRSSLTGHDPTSTVLRLSLFSWVVDAGKRLRSDAEGRVWGVILTRVGILAKHKWPGRQRSEEVGAGDVHFSGMSTLPLRRPPSATTRPGVAISPVTEPVARISIRSFAVTFPVTAPMMTTVFAEIDARMLA